MWSLNTLSEKQINQCLNTVSSNTLLFLIGDALSQNKPLSVVRMADGEHILMNWCKGKANDEVVSPNNQLDATWVKKFGIEGITYGELEKRIVKAANECTYFASSLSGITIQNYDCFNFSQRERYVDNFFTYAWTDEYKKALYKKAKKIFLIHRDEQWYRKLRKYTKDLDLEITFSQLTNWRDCDTVIAEGRMLQPKLVLFSAGPAGKYIGPEIAIEANAVTIDVGSGIERWMVDGVKRGSGELIDILH